MRIDPAGWPFILGALGTGAHRRVCRAHARRRRAARPVGLLPVLLPRPGSSGHPGGQGGAVARGRPRDGGGRANGQEFPAGELAADQHLSVADGRPRQPDAGGRACDRGEVSSRPFPAGLPGGRRRPQRVHRGLARPWRTDDRRPPDRGHPGAAHRVPGKGGRPGAGGRPLRRDEVRLADGRVRAERYARFRQGRRQRGGRASQ